MIVSHCCASKGVSNGVLASSAVLTRLIPAAVTHFGIVLHRKGFERHGSAQVA